jgi:hypothetical protein
LDVREQIGDGSGVRLALHVAEQDRDAPVEMLLQAGDLQIGVHFLVGLDEIALGAQPLDRRAQAGDVTLHCSTFGRFVHGKSFSGVGTCYPSFRTVPGRFIWPSQRLAKSAGMPN